MQRQLVKQLDLQPEEIPYLIGPKGDTVSQIRLQSGARVRFVKEGTREFAEIRGFAPQIEKAMRLIQEKLQNYHPHTVPTYQALQPAPAAFSAASHPFTVVIQMPQGAARYYQNPQGRSIFGDLNAVIKLEKNQITLRAQTAVELETNRTRLERILTNFACVAIPAPIWAVGRIIGRQGEGIQKIQQQVQSLTGAQCLVYFPEAAQADGIFSYAIVTSDDFRATQACTEIIIARLAAITEQGGVICDMLPSCGFRLTELPETDLHCQSYLQKMQLQHPGQRLRIVQSALSEGSAATPVSGPPILVTDTSTAGIFTSNGSRQPIFGHAQTADDVVDRFPTIFAPITQQPPQYYTPPGDQRSVEILLPLQPCAVGSQFDISKIILARQEFDIFADFELEATQATPVDRKFLVISARPEDLEQDSFWRNLVHFTLKVLEMQFFATQPQGDTLADFCDIEFQAFPGKAVLMPKVASQVSSASELSDALLRRDLTSRFIAGVSGADFEYYLKGSNIYYFWKAQLCEKSLMCGNNKIWHRVQVEKPVYIPARPTCEDDLTELEDFPDLPVQVLKRAICVQIMIHLGNFAPEKRSDLLILLKSRPRDAQDPRFAEYIKQIQNLTSQDAFVNTTQFDDDEKEDEYGSKYGVASLPLPALQQPDIFISNESTSVTLNDRVPAAPIQGLHPANSSTRGQLIASQTLSLEQPNATLIECRYKFTGNLAVLHTDVVDFGATGDRRKHVVTLQPNCGGIWGNEGVKCAAYAIENPDFGKNLKQFVWECIDICK